MNIYESKKIGEMSSKDGEEFSIFLGLDKKLVDDVKKKSLDVSDLELQKNTGDRIRFGEGSYEEWYKKGRTPFALVNDKTGALAALLWFGPKPLAAKSPKFGKEEEYEIQNKWHTIAFRSYPDFRGKGIMKNFSNFVLDFYKKMFPEVSFWTGTDSKNEPFIKLMLALGFKAKEEASDPLAHWLIFTK